jgi:hypothetical protein
MLRRKIKQVLRAEGEESGKASEGDILTDFKVYGVSPADNEETASEKTLRLKLEEV